MKVRKAPKQMQIGKTTIPNDILIEAWICLGKVGCIWLTRVFNKILITKKDVGLMEKNYCSTNI